MGTPFSFNEPTFSLKQVIWHPFLKKNLLSL